MMIQLGSYLSYEAVTQACNALITENGSAVGGLLVGAKGIAVVFILLMWIKDYLETLKSNDPEKKSGISLHSIAKGIGYILLVVSFNNISDLLDRGLGAYESAFDMSVSEQMYESYNKDWLLDEENKIINDNTIGADLVNSSVALYKEVKDMVSNSFDPFYWLMQILKPIAWAVNVFVFPMFLIERGFLLLVMKLSAPLVLALGAIEAYRPLVKKWIMLYCAVFLTGAFLVLATQFADGFYKTLVNNFDLEDSNLSQLMIFSVVAFGKVKLYKAAVEISYKIFNA